MFNIIFSMMPIILMSIRVEYYKISCVYNQYPMYPNTAEKREKININPKILINRKLVVWVCRQFCHDITLRIYTFILYYIYVTEFISTIFWKIIFHQDNNDDGTANERRYILTEMSTICKEVWLPHRLSSINSARASLFPN